MDADAAADAAPPNLGGGGFKILVRLVAYFHYSILVNKSYSFYFYLISTQFCSLHSLVPYKNTNTFFLIVFQK